MVQTVRYPTKQLDCWSKAKELRMDYYRRYREDGKLRWTGSGWGFDALPSGLGPDVVGLTTEPYAASMAFNPEFSQECVEATEARGWARDLCSYMRNYLGSMFTNRYLFGGEFPKPDFCFQVQLCSTHSKWMQYVSEYYNVPYFCIDASVGAHSELDESRLEYLVDQMHECIEWMEKITGRTYDDERLIQSVYDECRTTATWADICALNKAVPAPLDEKSMFALYVLATLEKHATYVADFYEELRDEVKGRIARGIAAVPIERCRLLSDTIPPWGFLSLYRYLEKYGAVSVGSIYTFTLEGIWEDQPDGTWGGAKTPQQRGVEIKTRDQALRVYAEWNLRKPDWQHFYNVNHKTEMMLRIVREWKVDGVMMHYNRGCESSGLGIAENRLGLVKAGIPVLTYEGNMADARENDEMRTLARIDAFMEGLGLQKQV